MRKIAVKMEEGGQWVGVKPELRIGQILPNRESSTGYSRVMAVEIQTVGSPDYLEKFLHYTSEPSPKGN